MAKQFEYIRHKRVSEEIVDLIMKQIHSGVYKAGQKFPPERVLCEELGVSRNTLREAFRIMERMGYIHSVVGSGNYVNKISYDQILSSFSMLMKQNYKLAADFVAVRLHLEVYMTGLAAKLATDDQIENIRKTVENMREDIKSGGLGIEEDNAFHLEIARASQNHAFLIITELCSEMLAESRKIFMSLPEQPGKTLDDHIAIYEAIKDRDEIRASAEMTSHLEKAKKILNEVQ